MRYVKVSVIPTEGDIDPVASAIEAHPSLTRESILHISRLNDGTAVLLTQIRGEEGALDSVLASSEEVLSYDVYPQQDGLQAYVHTEPTAAAASLLELEQEHEFVLDMPIEYGPDGGLKVAVIGREETVRRAIEDIPEWIRVELEQLSDYDPYPLGDVLDGPADRLLAADDGYLEAAVGAVLDGHVQDELVFLLEFEEAGGRRRRFGVDVRL